MQDWDTTLKLLIRESADTILPILGAESGVKRWLNVELPKTQNLRVDLLAELLSGQLTHIELQSRNDQEMPFRMLEYAVAIYRREGRFPIQILAYVGNEPLRMQNYFRGSGIDFKFEIVDLRTLDGTALLASEEVSDNLLALTMGLQDKRQAMRRIVTRINRLDAVKRGDAFTRFLITCEMRKLLAVAIEEIERMPIVTNHLEDPFAAKIFLGGQEKGREEGRDLGKKEVVRLLLEKRFGSLPAWVDERLSACSTEQVDDLAVKILNAPTLNQLFG